MTDRYLETASRIGYSICRDAIWSRDQCNWLGMSVEPYAGNYSNVLKSLSPDVYGGTAGIALFLTRLYEQSQEPFFKETAAGAMKHAIAHAKSIPVSRICGLYSGLTGIAYVADICGKALEHPEWEEWGQAQLKHAADFGIQQETSLDVVSGLAGMIPALLAAGEKYREESVDLGNKLIALADHDREGSSWKMGPDHPQGQKNLTGFSHGTAGFAWALLELYSATHEPRFRDTALSAISYENCHFSQEARNWPDFRQPIEQNENVTYSYGSAWCHGAPGIGLSRIRAFEIEPENVSQDDIQSALATTYSSFSTTSGNGTYCLCHGHGGNAELFLEAGRRMDHAESRNIAQAIGDQGIERYAKHNRPWQSGSPAGSNPSLLVGESGVGYFYLRLHDSEKVPSVLLLNPAA